MRYHHTQTGFLGPALFVPMAVVFMVIVIQADGGPGGTLAIGAFFVLVGAVMTNFSRLTTTIDDDSIHLTFGWGWPRREIILSEITIVDLVRNKWWYGFGVRYTPHGWLYNVWGFDAVEVHLSNGKAVRVGTDEPQTLAEAIKSSVPQ